MSASSPPGNIQPGTRESGTHEAGPLGRIEAPSFLDAGACLELLGTLYPLSASMLFFHLEAFLRENDAVSLAGEASLPRRLLLANLSSAHTAASSHAMELEPVGTDVVVDYDPAAHVCTIGFIPAGAGPSSCRPRGCDGPRLRIHVQEDSGLSKWVSVPLQVLITGWGDVSAGFQCFTHTLEFADEERQSLERWAYVGVAPGGWMTCMDEFEGEVRSGANRRFSAAWQKYTGAARVVLHSVLAKVNQTEDAALDWEEGEISQLSGASGSLNLAPGGLAGMRLLFEEGILRAPRVSIQERELALASWGARPESPPPPPGLPHMVALAWHGEGFVKPDPEYNCATLTPAKVVELRRLARSGMSVDAMAAAIGTTNLDAIRAAVGATS